MPAWQRWLFAISMAAGGGAFAAWGTWSLFAWIGALWRHDPIVRIENILFAGPLMGGFILMVGLAAMVPDRLLRRWKAGVERYATVAMAAGLIGIVMLPVGWFAPMIVMAQLDYHQCDSEGRGRYRIGVWAAPGRPCPPRA